MPKASLPRSAMSARLLELAAEMHTPEPYPVTEVIVIHPPTRTRRKAMSEAEMKIYLCSQLQAQAIALSSTPAPVMPEDATEDQRLDHKKAYAEWEKKAESVNGKMAAITAERAGAEADYEKAFFGDAYEDVVEYFEDKPVLWAAFIEDINSEFLPTIPDDGKCPKCGHVNDEEAAGKAPESST